MVITSTFGSFALFLTGKEKSNLTKLKKRPPGKEVFFFSWTRILSIDAFSGHQMIFIVREYSIYCKTPLFHMLFAQFSNFHLGCVDCCPDLPKEQ